MSKAEHLTKEQELYLGEKVQNMIKAKKSLEQSGLTMAQQNSYKRQIVSGEEAVAQLVESNTGLVYSLAKNFKSKYPGGPAFEDLVQDGMAGLVTAIMRYDPSRGNKLSTVATYWIFQSITRWTNKTGRLVKLPENRVTDYTKITKLRSKYEGTGLQKSEIDDLIRVELGLSKDDMFFINGAASTHASLNKVIDAESDKELIELVFDDVNDSAESVVMADATYQIIVDLVSDLSEIEQDILVSNFSLSGIMDSTPMTPKQVREKYDLSLSKYKRILNATLSDFEKSLKELDLNFEDFING